MSKKQDDKKIRLEYHYDRLATRKMAQAYQVLVPIDIPLPASEFKTSDGNNTDKVSIKKGDLNEDNGDLCTGFLQQAKR
ncbi:MAG: hypothetical protein GY820_14385 [Gammaproteobacteria bacterium]|nr:hypothetical protein [Gammaproteobacteria bacterium]